jgi:putative glycosyltransferase (TIGR04372 family)
MLSNFVASLRKANARLIGGMFFHASPGHMLSESDYLLRLMRIAPVFKRHRPVVLLDPTAMATAVAEVLRFHGVETILHPDAATILREIQLFYPDLVVDVGQAHWKLVLADKESHAIGDLYPQSFGWALKAEEFINQHLELMGTWQKTAGQLPFREALSTLPTDPAFLQRLAEKKYVVVQIKAATGNGTASIIPPANYCTALEFLHDNGFAIILGGREPLPEAFKRFEVWDYPRTPFACPANDFHLLAHAACGLFTPSGANMFCDTLGTPCCQLGLWTMLPQLSPKTVVVPCLLRHRMSGHLLTFSEQANAFLASYDRVLGPALFDSVTYEDLQPSSEDIVNGLREALCPSPPPPCQAMDTLRSIDPIGMWRAAACRFSPSFLANHPDFVA